ncbi:MAG: tetratricopeptide repeat protein [Bacteroidales bacterium]|nr:tetratricopeptide repeat protein [Bacteroidales bacterium]
MIVEEIIADRTRIRKNIEERRLFEVFKQLEELLSFGTSPYLDPKFEAQKTTYSYMTQYMLQGVDDLQRDKLYADLIESLYEIVDNLFDDLLLYEVSDYIYDKRRYYKLKGGMSIRECVELLKEEQKKYKLLKEAEVEEELLVASLKNIENFQEELFAIISSSFNLIAKEDKIIKQLLNVKEFGEVTTSLVVSALTLSTIYFYSEEAILTLYDTYATSESEEVKQRALCGALILSYIHRTRVNASERIKKRINLFSDDYRFCRDVQHQFFQFIRSMDTEKISHIFTHEIMPELIKLNPELQSKISFEDLSDEDLALMLDRNPDWEKKIEKSGLVKKLQELNELQVEGSDVLMSTFSSLKGYPFFNKITNWLRPYTSENSEIYTSIKKEAKLGELLKKSMFMCSSDRYSLALTVTQMKEQRNKLIKDIPDDVDINEMFGDNIDKAGGMSKSISTLYIQDLYRLFTLSKYKLPNIFDQHINLIEVEALMPVFDEENTLRLLGEFYLKKEYYYFAQKYFDILITRNSSDAILYQKLGYCKQMLKDYEGAIEEYGKADNISEDFWTMHHLALCYRAAGNISKALEHYQDALRIKPDSLTIEFQIGYCLMMNRKYEEALKHFYKVDFISEGSPKTWRPIAWCSLVLGKLQQAETFYDKIFSRSPKSADYLNMGHIHLVQKRVKEACENYKKSIELKDGDKSFFSEAIERDYATLIKLGVSENDIAIICDIVTQMK